MQVEKSQPTTKRSEEGQDQSGQKLSKREWETANHDLTKVLEQQIGTAEEKLKNIGDIIYQQALQSEQTEARQSNTTNNQIQEASIDRQTGQGKKGATEAMEEASDPERESFMLLQGDIKTQLVSLRRAENLISFARRRNKQEHGSTKTPSSL